MGNDDCKVNEGNLKDLDENEKKTLMDCNKQCKNFDEDLLGKKYWHYVIFDCLADQEGDKCKDCFETTQCVQEQMKQKK